MSPWKSQPEWQRTGINGESRPTFMVWPTIGATTAKQQKRYRVITPSRCVKSCSHHINWIELKKKLQFAVFTALTAHEIQLVNSSCGAVKYNKLNGAWQFESLQLQRYVFRTAVQFSSRSVNVPSVMDRWFAWCGILLQQRLCIA